MRKTYITTLFELAKEDSDIIVLLGDNGIIVYDDFWREIPNQIINTGIAEANMVSLAAGMASRGKKPFIYTIIPFITHRVFDQIRCDIIYQQMNVTIVGTGAGYGYAAQGPTHHATDDVTLMRALPGLPIITPADKIETEKATLAAAQMDGPVYLRLSVGKVDDIYNEDYEFKIGSGVQLRKGKDITIIGCGTILSNIIKAREQLKIKGISVRVINLHTIKPLDKKIILKAAQETRHILTVEEHTILGGLGSSVAEVLAEDLNELVFFKRMGLNDTFCRGYGKLDEVRKENNLTIDHIVREAQRLLIHTTN